MPAFGEIASLLISIPCSAFRCSLLLGAPWDAPSTALLKDLNILPFQERVTKLKAKIVFNELNDLLLSYIAEKF